MAIKAEGYKSAGGTMHSTLAEAVESELADFFEDIDVSIGPSHLRAMTMRYSKLIDILKQMEPGK